MLMKVLSQTHICKRKFFRWNLLINVFLIYLVIFFKKSNCSNKYYPNYFVKNDNTYEDKISLPFDVIEYINNTEFTKAWFNCNN